MTQRWGDESGSSFVELLISMLLVAILSGMSYSFARAALYSARVQDAKSETQEANVLALDVLTRELRMAGFSTSGQPLIGVRVARADRIEVVADLNGDGDLGDPNETVSYTYDEEKHQLMRATSGGFPQPFARHVSSGGVQFSFYDAMGASIAIPPEGMSADARRRIRRIDAALRLELPGADPLAAAPVRASLETSVYLRNQFEASDE